MPRRRVSSGSATGDQQPVRRPPDRLVSTEPEPPKATTGVPKPSARDRILNAAHALFAAHGFEATATKEIAWQAGVTNGLIFYYFPTKRALLLALVSERSFLPELKAVIESELAGKDDPRAALTAIGLRFFEFMARHATLIRLLAREALAHAEVLEHWRALRDEGQRLITRYLETAIRSDRLLPVDASVLARLFIAGIAVDAALVQPGDPHSYVSQAVDIVLRGFAVEA